ncbi:hypothetical protein [Plantactinospora sp. BB1]|uniref:hypothetical protein n=1 Tax=Plantactinospora sp. BB1 TaxID=2071627 RepID=UPI000D15BA5B|nr:hypothetical protein [Plantactinospora sp. BB1]AVT36783.1 hypothetical protein C6W10_10180 [Plantactinospora sp. BB1]
MSSMDVYVNEVRSRLLNDGCVVTDEAVGLMTVSLGYKAQMRALSKMHIFTAVAKLDRATEAEVHDFVDAAVNLAVGRKGQWRGLQSGVIVLPILVVSAATSDAVALMDRAYRLNIGGFAVFVHPAVVDVKAGKVWTFRGTRIWGYAFNSLIKQKYSLYLPEPPSSE